MDFINHLRNITERLAHQSSDVHFEYWHLLDVVHYATKLSRERQLDQRLCLAIAYGHDLGRLKEGVIGKGHAKAGARCMQTLFKQNKSCKYTYSEQRIICHAIAVHNQKNKCHGPYDELIKDADSLAHHTEGVLNTPSELWRVQLCENPGFNLNVASVSTWQQTFAEQQHKILVHLAHSTHRLEHPDVWVHQARTGIRSVRSIAWALDLKMRHLKVVANRLENARSYHVALTLLPKEEPYYHKLTLKLRQEHNFIHRNISQWLVMPTVIADAGVNHDLENVCKQAFMSYLTAARDVNINDQEGLHRIRIQGKRLICWSDLGLITLSPEPLLNAIRDLHHHIGKYRDCVIIKQETRSKALESLEKSHRKAVRQTLLYLKLMAREQ